MITEATWDAQIVGTDKGVKIVIEIDGLPNPDMARTLLTRIKEAIQNMGRPPKLI